MTETQFLTLIIGFGIAAIAYFITQALREPSPAKKRAILIVSTERSLIEAELLLEHATAQVPMLRGRLARLRAEVPAPTPSIPATPADWGQQHSHKVSL